MSYWLGFVVSRDLDLLIEIENNFRLVNYKIGRIEFEPTSSAAKNLASRLASFLKEHTGIRWVVSVVSRGGSRTLKEERMEREQLLEKEARTNPIVRAVFDSFPSSKFHNLTSKKMIHYRDDTVSDFQTSTRDWDPLERE